MIRVVMEEHELAGARIKRERNDTAQRTMTPADVFRIFLIRILCIENDYVAVLQEFDNLRAFGDWRTRRASSSLIPSRDAN